MNRLKTPIKELTGINGNCGCENQILKYVYENVDNFTYEMEIDSI